MHELSYLMSEVSPKSVQILYCPSTEAFHQKATRAREDADAAREMAERHKDKREAMQAAAAQRATLRLAAGQLLVLRRAAESMVRRRRQMAESMVRQAPALVLRQVAR